LSRLSDVLYKDYRHRIAVTGLEFQKSAQPERQ